MRGEGSKGEPHAVTIRDVARLSGVSIATVTRTFQDSPRVRPETSQRVRRAAEQLGYRPDAVARSLVTGRANAIGVLVPSLAKAYWDEVADAIEARAGDAGLSIVLASTRGEPEREREMLDLLFAKRLDGIILAGLAGDPRHWSTGNGRRPPLVLIEWDATPRWELLEQLTDEPLTPWSWRLDSPGLAGDWLSHIYYDDVAGAAEITQHLLDQGHTDIGFVAGPPVRTSLMRLLGVRATLETAGHRLRYARTAEDTFESSRALGLQLLADPDRPTALVCYSDVMAIGVVKAAHELGLNVPDDISITGYDDIEVSSYINPALTTIHNPKRELGELAVELLLGAQGDGDNAAVAEHRLTGSLVVRESTRSVSPVMPPGR